MCVQIVSIHFSVTIMELLFTKSCNKYTGVEQCTLSASCKTIDQYIHIRYKVAHKTNFGAKL